MKTVKRIAVVGGGTAGFVTALILKTRLNAQVDIIHSSKIGVIGVGEGSTEHWREFMTFIGETPFSIIQQCDATFKLGIMFQNWGESDYFHSIQSGYSLSHGQTPTGYLKIISDTSDPKKMSDSNIWNNKVYLDSISNPNSSPSNQYHFNTFKLNEFLHKKAKQLGINIYDDEIEDIVLNDSGEISSLKGQHQNYNYDFYIDSTGAKKLLMTKLGAKWQSYSKYLKLKAAIAYPTSDTDEYNQWTLTRAMDYGWMWRIPVWGRWGNGYVYDSDYIEESQAKAEVEKYLGHEIEIGRSLKFDPGTLDKFWIKNCVATGLSSSFVEPLEASSIGSTIQMAFLLMHLLPVYDDISINTYNKHVTDIVENIRDFVALHYITKKDNTQFWRDIQKMPIPESLQANLEKWKTRIPIKMDFADKSPYIMFTELHHIHVLQGLGLFNRDALIDQYKGLNPHIRSHIEQNNNFTINEVPKRSPLIGHKEAISIIRKTPI